MDSKEQARERNMAILARFLPEGTAETAYQWIQQYRFRFRISKARNSKFGDYRSPAQGELHRISVNHDLNKYAFLITFCHEVAHLVAWEKFRDRVLPHGKEWKDEFAALLRQFTGKNVFPADIEVALDQYIINPKASSCTDHDLFRVLKKYDLKPVTHLEEVPMGSVFILGADRYFRKGKKQRTRYLCQSLEDRKMYYISGIAEVKLVAGALAFE